MSYTFIFIIWLTISLAIAIYGKISLRDFFIYLLTCVLFISGISLLYYIAINFLAVPVSSAVFPKKINPSSWKESFAVGSICVFVYSVNYLWFKKNVRESDTQKLKEAIESIKEVKTEIDKLVLEIHRSKREKSEPKDVLVKITAMQDKIHHLEKTITPWLLNRL